MIQCICCEDWFHGQHLEGPIPESYGELICKDCTSRMDFLKYYQEEMLNVTDGEVPTQQSVEVSEVSTQQSGEVSTQQSGEVSTQQSVEVRSEETVEGEQGSGSEEKGRSGHDDGPDRKKMRREVCRLEERCDHGQIDGPIDGPSFWSEKWRESLCKCEKCLEMYEEMGCCFLTDPDDTVHSYEERGRRDLSGGSCIEEAGQQALENRLSSMPRAAQIEMIHGYNDLKEALTSFLRPFSERGEVVTTDHVNRFIQEFRKKKESEPKVDVYSGCH